MPSRSRLAALLCAGAALSAYGGWKLLQASGDAPRVFSPPTKALGAVDDSLPEVSDSVVESIRVDVAKRGAEQVRTDYAKRASATPNDPDARARLGIVYLGTGQTRLALPELQKATEKGTQIAAAYRCLGAYYKSQEDHDRSAPLFRRLVLHTPSDPQAQYDFGMSLLYTEELHEAISALKRCAHLAPNYPSAYQALGNAYLNRNELDESVKALMKCVELSPENYIAWTGLARVYLKLANADEAERAFRRALEIRPDRVEPHEGLGDVYLLRPVTESNTQKALDSLTVAQEANPTRYRIHVSLAEVYRRRGQTEKAVESLQMALKLGAEEPSVKYTLAQTLRKLGREEEAARLLAGLKAESWSRPAYFLQRKIDFIPNDVKTRLELGRTYQRNKQHLKALRQFDAAARIDPRNPVPLRLLTKLYVETGKTALAMEARDRAAALADRR